MRREKLESTKGSNIIIIIGDVEIKSRSGVVAAILVYDNVKRVHIYIII